MKTLILFIIATSAGGFTSAADRYLKIDTPRENDRVDFTQPILVGGTGKGLFEGNVVIRIEDMDGTGLAQVPTTMRRDDIAAEGTWQTRVWIPQPAPTEIKLIAFSPSPKEGDAAITSNPVVLKTTGPALENAYWHLHQFLGESGEMTPVLPETTVDAKFSNGVIGGSAGCNRYFGRYSAGEDDRLTVASEIGSTQMACAPAIARQEQRYLALLSSVSAWQRDDEALLLFDDSRQPILKYVAAKLTALEDTSWQATGINNGRGGVVASHTTHLATALFSRGKISGNAGCNQFTASYQIHGSRISVAQAATTRKHCAEPNGIMEQEQQYLQALARAHRYTLTPDGLELRDENGSLQVSYRVHRD